MIGKLGANSKPKLPDVVINPSENFSGYFCLINIGYNNPPSAMIVTPEAPVNAVNIAQIKSDTIPSPPGKNPKNAFAILINRSGVLLSDSMNPANVNNGIATSIDLFERSINEIRILDKISS